MLILYALGVWLYRVAVYLAQPFVPKARLWVQGRRKWHKRYAKATAQLPAGKRIWIHCASLGEFEQGRPVIEALRRDTDAIILLTFYSPSGYEVCKNYAQAHWVGYLPADSPANARDFIRIMRPEAAVFVKYELWLHYLAELRRRKLPAYLISAYFRANQAYFRWPNRGLYAQAFKGLQRVFVQNESTSEVLKTHFNLSNCVVAGDTRADRVAATALTPFDEPVVAAFAEAGPLLVAGSTWPADEAVLFATLQTLNSQCNTQLRLLIAPHEVNETRLAEIEQRFGSLGRVRRLSQINIRESIDCQIIIVDSIGKLGLLYRYARLTYVGGGFGKGIHNTLEPAAFGVPIAFGPKHQRFEEAQDLIAAGAARSFASAEPLTNWFSELLTDEAAYKNAAEAAAEIVQRRQGATAIIVAALRRDLGLE